MKSHPTLSIIIPTLNEQAYLPQLLRSLEKQTLTDFEVFVVDAGSKDATRQIAQSFNKKIPLTFLTAKKKNVGYQRNLGAQKARGEWLVFLDADVQIPATFLGKAIKKLYDQHIDFATTRALPQSLYWYDHMGVFAVQLLMFVTAYIYRPFMSGENIFIKKVLFQRIRGFDESVLQADDHEMVQRAAHFGKGRVLFSPTHSFSFRRFEREGRLTVLKKYARATIHILLKGPIRQPLFDYNMGGSVKA